MSIAARCQWCQSVSCICGMFGRGVTMYGAPAPVFPKFPSYPNAFPRPLPDPHKMVEEAYERRLAELLKERDEARAALAHEKDRARRVVRVFWRIDGWDGCCYIRHQAIEIAKERHGGRWQMCLRRVTVRRVKRKAKL